MSTCAGLTVCVSRPLNLQPWPRSLKDDDLAGRMGLQLKELNKVMVVLEKDQLIKVYVFAIPGSFVSKLSQLSTK